MVAYLMRKECVFSNGLRGSRRTMEIPQAGASKYSSSGSVDRWSHYHSRRYQEHVGPAWWSKRPFLKYGGLVFNAMHYKHVSHLHNAFVRALLSVHLFRERNCWF